MTLTLVHPRLLNSIDPLPANTYWLYADDDTQRAEDLDRRFGRTLRLASPADFQARAVQLRKEFVQWTDLCLDGRPAEDWIPVSYFKDIFTAPVFLHFVCLVLLKESLTKGKAVLVITASHALAEQLKDLSRRLGQPLALRGGGYFKRDFLRIQWLAWRHLLLRPLRLLVCTVFARCTLGKRQVARLRDVQVLVDTFLFEGDLDVNGNFRDRFLPGLIRFYQKEGFVAASTARTENVPLFQVLSTYKAMRASNTLFAPSEMFLTVRDILRGQWRAALVSRRRAVFGVHRFEGIDVEPLVRFWWDVATRRTVVARIMAAVPMRMQGVGIKPKLFLDWYENQALDKAMQVGFNRIHSDTQVVAIRQYFPAGNVVSFFSTGGEVRSGASPRVNWVCGKRTAELFAVHDPEGVYVPVPALRYAHLFNDIWTTKPGDCLVLFLTSSLEESLTILNCVFTDLESTLNRFTAIRVKPHQALKVNIATLAATRWPDIQAKPVTWETATSDELLQSAGLVLTAGSSVAVEALCRGIPVVLTGRTAGLDVNPLEDVACASWKTVYSPEEFVGLLDYWLPSLPSLTERQARGREIRENYFEASSEVHMHSFLPPSLYNVT